MQNRRHVLFSSSSCCADHMEQQDEFCKMEKERLKRIERNQAMMKMFEVPQAAQQLAHDLAEEAAAQQAAKQAVKQALLKPTVAAQPSRPTRRAAKAAAQKLVEQPSPATSQDTASNGTDTAGGSQPQSGTSSDAEADSDEQAAGTADRPSKRRRQHSSQDPGQHAQHQQRQAQRVAGSCAAADEVYEPSDGELELLQQDDQDDSSAQDGASSEEEREQHGPASQSVTARAAAAAGGGAGGRASKRRQPQRQPLKRARQRAQQQAGHSAAAGLEAGPGAAAGGLAGLGVADAGEDWELQMALQLSLQQSPGPSKFAAAAAAAAVDQAGGMQSPAAAAGLAETGGRVQPAKPRQRGAAQAGPNRRGSSKRTPQAADADTAQVLDAPTGAAALPADSQEAGVQPKPGKGVAKKRSGSSKLKRGASGAQRPLAPWCTRAALWDLFQEFGPNAAGQFSKQQLQQQQEEAGLVADVDCADNMVQLVKQLATGKVGTGPGVGGGRDWGSSSELIGFEEFVLLAQHVGGGAGTCL